MSERRIDTVGQLREALRGAADGDRVYARKADGQPLTSPIILNAAGGCWIVEAVRTPLPGSERVDEDGRRWSTIDIGNVNEKSRGEDCPCPACGR